MTLMTRAKVAFGHEMSMEFWSFGSVINDSLPVI